MVDAAAAPGLSASDFVTQAQFDSALSQLGASVQQLLAKTETKPVPEYVGGDGNNADPYAAASAIDDLSNVTISNPTITGLTAGDIPDLSGKYVSLNGGAVIGSLAVTGTTTFASTYKTTAGDLITNGNFNGSSAGWVLGSSVVHGTNDLISTYSPDHADAASTTFQTIAGNTYLLTFTVTQATGTLYVYLTHDSLDNTDGMQGPFGGGTHTVAFPTNYTGTEIITFDYWDGYTWGNSVFGNPVGETWSLSDVSINQITSPSPALVVTGYDGST